jgi:hypothetical protein
MQSDNVLKNTTEDVFSWITNMTDVNMESYVLECKLICSLIFETKNYDRAEERIVMMNIDNKYTNPNLFLAFYESLKFFYKDMEFSKKNNFSDADNRKLSAILDLFNPKIDNHVKELYSLLNLSIKTDETENVFILVKERVKFISENKTFVDLLFDFGILCFRPRSLSSVSRQ